MKITSVETMVIENVEPYRGGRYLLFLEIKTDEGIVGLGERITGNTYSKRLKDLRSQIDLIEEYADEFLVGEILSTSRKYGIGFMPQGMIFVIQVYMLRL